MAHDWHTYAGWVNAQLEAWKQMHPTVQFLFLRQLAQQLAEQLDCERGNCQLPVFETSAPPCYMPGAMFERDLLPVVPTEEQSDKENNRRDSWITNVPEEGDDCKEFEANSPQRFLMTDSEDDSEEQSDKENNRRDSWITNVPEEGDDCKEFEANSPQRFLMTDSEDDSEEMVLPEMPFAPPESDYGDDSDSETMEAFQVQEGAATGRSGRATGRQGVDDSARAGALGVLGLRLLRHTLQGSKKQDGDGGDGGNALEEVVPAVVTCFSSRQDRLFVASAKCLGLLRGYFDSRPEVLGQYGASIAHTVLKTFEITASAPRLSQHLRAKAKTHGLAGVGAEAMLATSTRLLAAPLNQHTSAEWFRTFGDEEAAPQQLKVLKEEKEKEVKGRSKAKKEELRQALQKSTVFDALVWHIQNHQCIDTIGKIMITGSDKRTSQQCAQIFVDFMLDYPHEQKALQHRMNHLLKNLGYAEEGGRRAALNCLYLVVLHFPEAQLSSWSSLIFAAAAARLSAETDATADQMLHVLILSLLRKINASSRERLLDLVLKWRLSAPTVLARLLEFNEETQDLEESQCRVQETDELQTRLTQAAADLERESQRRVQETDELQKALAQAAAESDELETRLLHEAADAELARVDVELMRGAYLRAMVLLVPIVCIGCALGYGAEVAMAQALVMVIFHIQDGCSWGSWGSWGSWSSWGSRRSALKDYVKWHHALEAVKAKPPPATSVSAIERGWTRIVESEEDQPSSTPDIFGFFTLHSQDILGSTSIATLEAVCAYKQDRFKT